MRIQILPLPSNVVGEVVEEPFALVVDQVEEATDETHLEYWSKFGAQCGARSTLVTPATVEVVDRYLPDPVPAEPAPSPEVVRHRQSALWSETGERLRAELDATNANHASWIPHPYSPTGLTLCAACELPEREEVHQHKCAEAGCTAFEL